MTIGEKTLEEYLWLIFELGESYNGLQEASLLEKAREMIDVLIKEAYI